MEVCLSYIRAPHERYIYDAICGITARYTASPCEKHEYNIAKAQGFYIAFAVRQKYRCKRQFAISLYRHRRIILYFHQAFPFSANYDTFKV